MRFLVVYAHPLEDSFQAALHRCVVSALRQAGHEVADLDLYAEQFCPVLKLDERATYGTGRSDTTRVSKQVEQLRWSDGVIFVFPVWWYGMPAMLKGYFDRVWLPGVAFEIRDGQTIPLLSHIKRLGVVTTYGSPWWLNALYLCDPNRRTFMRGIRRLCSPQARILWLAQYGLDTSTNALRCRFLKRVSEQVLRF
jgi:NAD(P)H dehydrogenase (quinone)